MTTDNMPPLPRYDDAAPDSTFMTRHSDAAIRAYARAYAEQQTAELRAEVERLTGRCGNLETRISDLLSERK